VIVEPARQTPILCRAEVVVLGGGPSGVAAAVAAARTGAHTVLVERYGFLGGMGTAAGVTSFCGLYGNVHGEIRPVVHGFADEVLERLSKLDALSEPHSIFGRTWGRAYDNAVYKYVLDQLVVEGKVTLFLHTFAAGLAHHDGHIDALIVESKSGRGAITGDVFIDASGDGDMAAWAGAPFEKGDPLGNLAYPTLMFRMGHVDGARALRDGKPALRALMAAAEQAGEYQFPRRSAYINPQRHAGEWRANVTQIAMEDGRAADGTSQAEMTFAEVEGRRQAAEYLRFLRERVPGFENAYLLESAPQVGIRETRRILGDYQLTGDDIVSLRDFPDTIGVNAWPIERHVRGDVEWTFLEGRGYCQLPYAMLLPRSVENLLVVGRCASLTREGQASARVSGPCFVMGQAGGTAAGMAVKSKVTPRAVPIDELQSALRAAGVYLG
jgi:glycine/D-amino acid oxidase-like deaminating enzyme